MNSASRVNLAFRPFTCLLVGAVSAGVVTYLLLPAGACPALSAAIFGGVVSALLNWAVPAVRRRWKRKAPIVRPWQRKQQAILLALVAICFAAYAGYLGLGFKTQLFHQAFGMNPPAGVKELQAEGHYAGGPGDQVYFLHFFASRQAIEQIMADKPMTRDLDSVENYMRGERDWNSFWAAHIGQWAVFKPAWATVPPMKEPELYHWSLGSIQGVTFLWDAATGEAYVIYTFG